MSLTRWTNLIVQQYMTAIHEVMEQQTVSIAKAAITTSLNARTAILAAANPAWGRYDLRRTSVQNINLAPTLLSRLDLMWLILDRADMDGDLEMARHVVYVRQNRESPALGFTPLEPSVRCKKIISLCSKRVGRVHCYSIFQHSTRRS